MVDIQSQLAELHQEFRAHMTENAEAHRGLSECMEEHMVEERRMRMLIFGNGEAGMAEQLRSMQRFCDTIRRLMWIVVPAVLLGAAAVVWQVVMASIKQGAI